MKKTFTKGISTVPSLTKKSGSVVSKLTKVNSAAKNNNGIITQKVKSSNLDTVTYNTKKRTLQILFLSGRTYEYMNVANAIFNALIKASSKGMYFDANIRYRYKYKEV